MGSPLEALRARTPEMTEALRALVEVESPSSDLAAVNRCADAVADLARDLLGAEPERLQVDGRTHLRWTFGVARIVLIGHMDTVWPAGTLAGWPFVVRDGVAAGPGVLDMKGGIVQGLYALSTLKDLDGIALLITSDEELGSPTSDALIEETARGAVAALVLEPAAGEALKTARKGVSVYEIAITGKEAHAGLEPERGVNALTELAHLVIALEEIGNPQAGTTVTPTVAHAGTATNVVPAGAIVEVDVRATEPGEQTRVEEAIRALTPRNPAAKIRVGGGINRGPMPSSASAELFARAKRLAAELGLPELKGAAVGGGSDGNFTAALGVPTLDGLGAVGGGAHARTEHLVISAMPERAALLAALIDDIRDRP
jgi:glutamate carboxypeptidase